MNREMVTGMVLSAMPIGDYDKRLVILTKERGRISAFAKGARRANSSLLACSQPFSFGNFMLYQGRSSYTVNSAEIQNYFEELRKDLVKVTYGMYFCELAAFLTYENIEATGILKLLYQSLRALEHKRIPDELIRCIFEIKALDMNGETPHVFACVKCGKKPEKKEEYIRGFSSKMGGLVCEECEGMAQDLLRLSAAAVYTLQYIVSSSVEKLYTFLLKEECLEEIKKVARQYMACYAQGTFHSLEMLEFFSGDNSGRSVHFAVKDH